MDSRQAHSRLHRPRGRGLELGELCRAAGKPTGLGLRLASQMKQARTKGFRAQLPHMLRPFEERPMRMQRLIEQTLRILQLPKQSQDCQTLRIVQLPKQSQDGQRRHRWMQTYQRQSE